MKRLLLLSLSPAALLVILTGPVVQVGVAQLQLPATLVGGLVAFQMLLAVLRPWLGRLGDGHPRGDQGRLALLRLGLALTWATLPLLLLGLLALGHGWPQWGTPLRALALIAALLLVLLLGTGNHLSQTMQAALLLSNEPPERRSAVVRRVWLWLSGFTVAASLLSGVLLRALAPLPLGQQLLGLWGLWAVVLLAIALSIQPRELPAERPSAAAATTTIHAPWQTLDRRLVAVLLLAHAPLYSQEVLVDPWATGLFGWPLAGTTTLMGLWALGALLGQLWAMHWPLPAPLAAWGVALLYGLCGLRGLIAPLAGLPIPALMLAMGLASGWLQQWLAGEVGKRCQGQQLGETVGWLGAAVVLSRSIGIAVAGPLLDGSGLLLGERTAGSFGLAFAVLAGVLAVGGWVCRNAGHPISCRFQKTQAGALFKKP